MSDRALFNILCDAGRRRRRGRAAERRSGAELLGSRTCISSGPDLSALRAIRFLTDDDYPPLDFALADGSLIGFNVEIARAICEELHIGCTIQARRWDTLVDSLETGKGDAVIASIAASAATRARIDFTQPYYKTPARFVGAQGFAARRRDAGDARPARRSASSPARRINRILATFFPAAIGKPYPNFAALHEALRAGAVDAVFADGLTLAVWLAGEDVGRLLRLQGRALHREPLFRRRRRHRRAQGGRRPAPRDGLGARPPRRRAASTPRSIPSIFRSGSTERAGPPSRRTAEEPTSVATGLVPAIPRRLGSNRPPQGDCEQSSARGASKPFQGFPNFSKEIPSFFQAFQAFPKKFQIFSLAVWWDFNGLSPETRKFAPRRNSRPPSASPRRAATPRYRSRKRITRLAAFGKKLSRRAGAEGAQSSRLLAIRERASARRGRLRVRRSLRRPGAPRRVWRKGKSAISYSNYTIYQKFGLPETGRNLLQRRQARAPTRKYLQH